ncbi:Hsp20/alpha crystallin family protein [Roseateles sp. DAIF2]|uniref:Hsp20/alpha crystallin family protein n=1 Tax=Roseateles sp. DAIF2 TaxID=2714952 RepID=UPI0018A2716E|nr:Hsp20/alpha crystallin family protein [Roseateles sp. DAIF2]QPF74292.1 Hsp20/alpha crystallin family protein [Roseateles sp. DAIF2]
MFVIPVARHPAAEFSRRIERLFDLDRQDAVALRSPALDISETDAAYTLRLDLPGVAREAVKVRIEGRKVSIDAEQVRGEAKEGERSLYRERAVTRFSRSINLPKEVTQADSSAKLDNGVLTLTLVKRQLEGSGELAVS